jgi:flagellar hook-associated protein 2
LAFNSAATNLDQTQAAQDAKVAINGLDVLSASNTLKDALQGVTLNLLQAQVGKQVNLAVSQNNADISKGVDGFIKAFNELAKTVKSLAGFDAAKKQGGILQGDATLRGGMSQLQTEMSNFVEGLSGSVRSLADLGIRTQADGSLSLDSSKLNSALASDRNNVAALFAVLGRPSDTGVTYLSSTSGTLTGGYALNVTQTATRGLLNGAAAASFVVDSNNDTFKIKVDGVQSGLITLTQKDYTADKPGLAAEMQARINGDSALKAAGASVTVSYDSAGNRFVLQSKSYGSASKVEITEVDTNSAATLGLAVASGTDGVDVAGTIGGQTTTGKGQELTGAGGDSNGLKLSVTGGTGDRGTVTFTRGLIEKLDKVLGGLLDSTGTISSKTQGLEKSLKSINDQREVLDRRMSDLEQRLLKRFNAMDSLVGRFQATSNALGQQLATLPLAQQNKK